MNDEGVFSFGPAPTSPKMLARMVVVGCIAIGFIFACHKDASVDAYDAGYVQAITQVHKRNREANESVELRLREQLAVKATVLTTILRQTDTVLAAAPMRPPQTHEDTVQAVVALPKVTAQLIDLGRSCSAYKSLADSTLTACDSTKASLRIERDDWKQKYEKEHPSGLRKAWDRVFPYLTLGFGLYVGSKATH